MFLQYFCLYVCTDLEINVGRFISTYRRTKNNNRTNFSLFHNPKNSNNNKFNMADEEETPAVVEEVAEMSVLDALKEVRRKDCICGNGR